MDKKIKPEQSEHLDHYKIGTAATGGTIKIYLEDIMNEEKTIKKINQAIRIWKHSRVKSGKG